MARVRAAALGAALLEAALGQCPTFGRRNYYAEHCEIITYDAASGFAYAWLNAGPCVAGFAAATDADVVAVWPEGADPPYKRNGPRRFMTTCVGFDDAAAVAARAAEPFRLANPPRALGGVEYAVQARLPFESAAAFEGWGDGGLAYEGVLVNRSAVMVWEAGSTVFELVDAAGKRYVMQSLSQIVVENLAPSDLEALPRDLPEGWSFRSRTASRGRDDFRELLLIGNLETHLAAPAPAPAPTAARARAGGRAAPRRAARRRRAAARDGRADGRARAPTAAPTRRPASAAPTTAAPTTPRPSYAPSRPPTSEPSAFPDDGAADARARGRAARRGCAAAVAATDAPPRRGRGRRRRRRRRGRRVAAPSPLSVFLVVFALGAAALHVRAARRGRAREAELAEMDKDGGLWSDRDEERKESDDAMDLRYTDA
ncbi:hypothetical protein SO694_00029158 [Aureococcus anophagefferens]|uniref:Uncharacterized protein n=1 Tax=Aureococcus anophagefferens TaxID=44056 RepID=A0ABR1FVU2_AURAN